MGRVVLLGRAHYLGRYDSPESWERYHRLLADSHAAPSAAPRPAVLAAHDATPTVDGLLVAYWDRHVTTYYVKDGRPTSERDNIRQALRFLRRLYGQTPARDFGPQALKLVRRSMIEAGRCRTLINKDVNRVRGLFRWAAEEELYPGDAYQALRAVLGLAKGRGEAKERPPVAQVAVAVVRATLPHLTAPIAAMVRLQFLTGARPGEVTSLRPRDVDRTDPAAWVHRPGSHKTEHYGRERVIVLGPRARAVLRPWLKRDAGQFCFRPVEAVAARNARGRADRPGATIPPVSSSASKPNAVRPPGERYTKDSYRWAIRRACAKAGVAPWTPHQLRHTRATQIRKKFGIEAAQLILGHAKADTTEIYAERDREKARRVMEQIG